MRKRLWGVVLVALCFGSVGKSANAQFAPDTLYPGRVELVAPFFGVDTMEAFKVENGVRTLTNTWVRRISIGIEDTTRVIRVHTMYVRANRSDTTKNRLLIDGDDLTLRDHDLWSPTDSGAAKAFGSRVWGWISGPRVPWQAYAYDPGRRVFPDDGIAPFLLELLPYAEGFSATVPQFVMWQKKEKYVSVRVLASEDLKSDTASVPCWVVEVNGAGGPPGYHERRWVSKNSRRLLKQVFRKGIDDLEYVNVLRGWY